MSGIIQSYTKRLVCELGDINKAFIQTSRTPLTYELSFSNQNMQGLVDLHHDALLITLQIANCKLKRVLIYNESSMNIMFLPALEKMHLDESLIIRDTKTLMGFRS